MVGITGLRFDEDGAAGGWRQGLMLAVFFCGTLQRILALCGRQAGDDLRRWSLG